MVAERAVDWSNALFLSCRFRAWRAGEFNEFVYNFFKSLSDERIVRAEAEARYRLAPPPEVEEIELGGYVMERWCPHRQADLSVFGEVEGRRADLPPPRLAVRSRDRPLPDRRGPPPAGAPAGVTSGVISGPFGRPVTHMALRRKNTVDTDGVELVRAWAAAAGGAPAGVSERLRDAAEDLAVAADRRPADLPGAVSRFGWQAGADGWPLDEIARWVETLARTAEAARRERCLTFDAGMELSAGWADGYLHGAGQDDCIDPTSGLARIGVLQLRLQQVYDHCASLGIQPDLVYALVVVDASLDEHPPLERNAARVALAGETRKLFAAGETVAVHDDRVLVLASRTPELADRVAILGAALHTHGLLRHDPVSTWVERLPADAADLRRVRRRPDRLSGPDQAPGPRSGVSCGPRRACRAA